MEYLLEYSKYNKFDIGDEVLIHYWWDHHITICKIIEKKGRKYLISHDVNGSKIWNAPDEWIKSDEIIDKKR